MCNNYSLAQILVRIADKSTYITLRQITQDLDHVGSEFMRHLSQGVQRAHRGDNNIIPNGMALPLVCLLWGQTSATWTECLQIQFFSDVSLSNC